MNAQLARLEHGCTLVLLVGRWAALVHQHAVSKARWAWQRCRVPTAALLPPSSECVPLAPPLCADDVTNVALRLCTYFGICHYGQQQEREEVALLLLDPMPLSQTARFVSDLFSCLVSDRARAFVGLGTA